VVGVGGGHGLVGQHHVELVALQAGHQALQRARLQRQHHRRVVQRRAQPVLLEVARQGGHAADAQALHPVATALQPAQHLLAQAEDLVGIGHDQLAGRAQHQAPALAVEQRLAQPVLQLPDLGRQADCEVCRASAARVR
jgi:hypothetical protein